MSIIGDGTVQFPGDSDRSNPGLVGTDDTTFPQFCIQYHIGHIYGVIDF
jgi:hypothetical protein